MLALLTLRPLLRYYVESEDTPDLALRKHSNWCATAFVPVLCRDVQTNCTFKARVEIASSRQTYPESTARAVGLARHCNNLRVVS